MNSLLSVFKGLVSIFQLLFMVDLNLCCTPDFHHCLGFQCVAADCHFMIILCISKEEFCPYFWCRVLILIDRQKFTICPETGMRLLMLLSKHHKQIILSIEIINKLYYLSDIYNIYFLQNANFYKFTSGLRLIFILFMLVKF